MSIFFIIFLHHKNSNFVSLETHVSLLFNIDFYCMCQDYHTLRILFISCHSCFNLFSAVLNTELVLLFLFIRFYFSSPDRGEEICLAVGYSRLSWAVALVKLVEGIFITNHHYLHSSSSSVRA